MSTPAIDTKTLDCKGLEVEVLRVLFESEHAAYVNCLANMENPGTQFDKPARISRAIVARRTVAEQDAADAWTRVEVELDQIKALSAKKVTCDDDPPPPRGALHAEAILASCLQNVKELSIVVMPPKETTQARGARLVPTQSSIDPTAGVIKALRARLPSGVHILVRRKIKYQWGLNDRKPKIGNKLDVYAGRLDDGAKPLSGEFLAPSGGLSHVKITAVSSNDLVNLFPWCGPDPLREWVVQFAVEQAASLYPSPPSPVWLKVLDDVNRLASPYEPRKSLTETLSISVHISARNGGTWDSGDVVRDALAALLTEMPREPGSKESEKSVVEEITRYDHRAKLRRDIDGQDEAIVVSQKTAETPLRADVIQPAILLPMTLEATAIQPAIVQAAKAIATETLLAQWSSFKFALQASSFKQPVVDLTPAGAKSAATSGTGANVSIYLTLDEPSLFADEVAEAAE